MDSALPRFYGWHLLGEPSPSRRAQRSIRKMWRTGGGPWKKLIDVWRIGGAPWSALWSDCASDGPGYCLGTNSSNNEHFGEPRDLGLRLVPMRSTNSTTHGREQMDTHGPLRVPALWDA